MEIELELLGQNSSQSVVTPRHLRIRHSGLYGTGEKGLSFSHKKCHSASRQQTHFPPDLYSGKNKVNHNARMKRNVLTKLVREFQFRCELTFKGVAVYSSSWKHGKMNIKSKHKAIEMENVHFICDPDSIYY